MLNNYRKEFDLIVVGAGHAGVEAAAAAARCGQSVLLITINTDIIAKMSCNPAIGGTAKGHLVREIDALGGLMGAAADQAGIQFRVLNHKRGPAVQSLRAQADKYLYSRLIKAKIAAFPNIFLRSDMVTELLTDGDRVSGVKTKLGIAYYCRALVVTTGTFMEGLMHIGDFQERGGRVDEPAATGISAQIAGLGHSLRRFKTGTPPRIDARSVNTDLMSAQAGDKEPRPFSFRTTGKLYNQAICWLTETNSQTHEIIASNLHRSPLYSGAISGVGPRYCPSIEDKIKKFPDRTSHHVFLEPEARSGNQWYCNGISTSMPMDVQRAVIRSIKGMEQAEIIRYGYAIEYDCFDPQDLGQDLGSKHISGIYLAGQINGTSGYEEAAAQGLVAGINASRYISEQPPMILGRDLAYIGVLIDDLVTKGTEEPYRMFTSRAEYRIILRSDNADLRLNQTAYDYQQKLQGAYLRDKEREDAILATIDRYRTNFIFPTKETNQALANLKANPIKQKMSWEKYIQRPNTGTDQLAALFPAATVDPAIAEEVTTRLKYAAYIEKQDRAIQDMHKLADIRIPEQIDYQKIVALRKETIQKLTKVRPIDVAQAARIPGVTPADAIILASVIKKGLSKLK